MIVLLSNTMLSDVDRRVALIAAVGGTSFVDFRHYFICRGMTPQEIRDRFPDLAPIYENVMLRPESDLRNVIEDVRHSAAQPIPTFFELLGRALVIILGTFIGLVLSQIGRLHALRLLIAAALAVLLYTHTSPTLTMALIAVCFYLFGLGLSRMDPLDLWPWLGRHWKWSASLDALHSPQPSMPFLGPVVLAAAVCGATAAIVTGDRTQFAMGLISGFVLQQVTDAACVFTARRRLRQASAALPEDLPNYEATCDPAHLRSAIASCLILRNFNLTVGFGSLLVISLTAVVGAARFPWPLALGWLAAFALGTLTPTFIAASWLAADLQVMRIRGLTTTHLRRTGEVYRRSGRAKTPYALGIDDASLAAFTEPQKEELAQFAFLPRIPAALSLRGWFMPRDSAFVSYVWGDQETVETAERLDATLRGIGIPSFRDTRAIRDPFAAWREHISSALARCTHFFLVVSPGIKNGQVVLREIETVVGRWYLEMLPAVILVVNPEDARDLRDDPHAPLHVRFLLTCCPQMTISEAADPRQLRYIVELTRRQGKWNDWLTMLSPRAARSRILRMPGIVRAESRQGNENSRSEATP